MTSLMDLLVEAAERALRVLGGPALGARRSQRLLEDWRRLAERAGLEVVEERSDAVMAKLGDLRVVCEGRARSPSLGFNGRITFSWVGVPGVSIATRRSAEPALDTTNDPSFDELFNSSGDQAVVRAILDRDTRSALLSLVAVLRNWTMTFDVAHARCLAASGQGLAEPRAIARRLAENTTREPLASVRARNMRQLAQAFPAEVVTRELARTLAKDIDPSVRLEAATALAEEGRPTLMALTRDEAVAEGCALQALRELGDSPTRAEVRAGLERAMGMGRWQLAAAWKKRLGAVLDADDLRAMSASLTRWRQRLSPAAVRALDSETERLSKLIDSAGRANSWGEEGAQRGRDTLVELTARRDQILADAGVPIATAIADALRRAPASEHRDAALFDALNGPWDVRLAAAAGLLRVPKRARHLWHRPELAPAVDTLRPADLPAAEEALFALLAHPDADVALAAVTQLAGVPRRDVIAALGACAERHATSRDVQRAVRQAIAEIQSRLPSASPGQLSLAGAEAGQVSLVEEDRRGQVSLERSGSE